MTSSLDVTDSSNSQHGFKGCHYYNIQEFLSSFSKQHSELKKVADKRIRNSNTTINNTQKNQNDSNLNKTKELLNSHDFTLLHINPRSVSKKFDSFEALLQSLVNFSFSVIGISETWLHANSPDI